MTLNLAETSVAKSRPSVPYGTIFYRMDCDNCSRKINLVVRLIIDEVRRDTVNQKPDYANVRRQYDSDIGGPLTSSGTLRFFGASLANQLPTYLSATDWIFCYFCRALKICLFCSLYSFSVSHWIPDPDSY